MNRPLRTTLVTGSAALATAAVAAAALGIGGGTETPQSEAPTQATAPVTRTTLVQTEEVNGTLGYGAPWPVSGATGAVLTWLPTPGATIARGRAVYRADNLPVVLFYGGLPLYRPLHVGDTGDDVKEIERNLAALGYSGARQVFDDMVQKVAEFRGATWGRDARPIQLRFANSRG